MNRAPLLVLSVVVAVGCGESPAADPRVPILGSASHRVWSSAVGDSFQISVVLPRSYDAEPTRRFPVVYLLDGNELTGVAASIAWELWVSGMPEVLLVGIDYPVSGLDQSQGLRFRDLTPSADTASISVQATEYEEFGLPAPTTSGGGPKFLTFLTDELGPRIDGLYRTVPSDRTLVGLSLGGLFALHALLQRPDYYRNYVALSPSLWWNNNETLERFESFTPEVQPAPRLFVSIGLLEEDPTYRMVTNVRRFEEILRARPDSALLSHFQYFPDENHNSGWPGALSRGLRYAFGLWAPGPGE